MSGRCVCGRGVVVAPFLFDGEEGDQAQSTDGTCLRDTELGASHPLSHLTSSSFLLSQRHRVPEWCQPIPNSATETVP